jgi:UDP-4-amino-4,6-dideoxy-N-acetyl-beta-L-altrosamine transaminase
MVYIDTNILIYLQNHFDRYHASSKTIFGKYFLEKRICISQIVLNEFFSIITDSRKNKIAWTGKEAANYIEYLTKSIASVHSVNNDILKEALSTIEKYKIKRYGIYDHLIACSMKYYGIDSIITVNKKDFEKYEFIKNIIVPEELETCTVSPSAGNFISYGKQWIDQTDINEVLATLTSDYLTQGPAVSRFEKIICEYTGAKYCVALSNATAALHIAVQALNIEHGKEGITSPNTFVASSNCLIYNGLKPVFADIDPLTYNIDPEEIRKRISDNTKVLIPVHFAGRPCDMVKIKSIADERELYIIEDAAHAIGSNYPDGSKVGNCKYSDMTIFSFHPVKTITTGEGGAITTNSKELYAKLVMLRSHGITKDPEVLMENPGPWYYEMQGCGYNFRLTDIQSALGTSQMKRLDEFKRRRNEIIEKYNSDFSGLDWITTPLDESPDFCFHLYVVQINFDRLGKSRADVMEELKKKNIGTQVHYIPVHTQPYYKEKFGYNWGDYPAAEVYYSKALSLALYPLMKDEEVDYVISQIKHLESFSDR